ncbi:hypothetical protein DL240_05490 [Lujinxingia litoralis]|uniref:Uncharacterized protein n=1 Tax=Lujinxingia litoralis TaxID=2211119 RepID=A0A328C6Z4_9DELT|nr:MazG nucleotide pyrophosphohydrolase domain-containing protein [Lujinxingia litoralis]RAL23613.1 hypothetical protein DL240_05490 [Lujinxingia litoralis]
MKDRTNVSSTEGESALQRAQRSGEQAASWGFDWPDVAGPLAKVAEELAELRAELPPYTDAVDITRERVRAELGDLLLAVVNLARHLNLDAEETLAAAHARFEVRLAKVQALAAARGLCLEALSLDELERLWQEVKRTPGLDSVDSHDL